MKNSLLDQFNKSVPYIGDLRSHPHVTVLEQYLESIDIPIEDTRSFGDDFIQYTFYLDSKVSVVFAIYRTDSQEVFCHFECAFGTVPDNDTSSIATGLLKAHHELYYPIRYAISPQSFVVIQFRSACSLVTNECVLLRAASVIQHGVEAHHEFTEKHGLLPLPCEWFKQTAVN